MCGSMYVRTSKNEWKTALVELPDGAANVWIGAGNTRLFLASAHKLSIGRAVGFIMSKLVQILIVIICTSAPNEMCRLRL